jgi:hypothetical protein
MHAAVRSGELVHPFGGCLGTVAVITPPRDQGQRSVIFESLRHGSLLCQLYVESYGDQFFAIKTASPKQTLSGRRRPDIENSPVQSWLPL